ncbi:hypothetical protein ILYODFUR_017388 [Ilyodon furcidens]|uniref:Uncharacterized protein n=1 Tax=Ilyodon furcidens TaxID=33524 RepID=A0ABV0SLX8_9TELE
MGTWWLAPEPPGAVRPVLGGVRCPRVLGHWVHGWICSGVDGCQPGLWAHRCSSVGLLHCGCWVVPLELSFALLCGGRSSPGYCIFLKRNLIHTGTHTLTPIGVYRYTDLLY